MGEFVVGFDERDDVALVVEPVQGDGDDARLGGPTGVDCYEVEVYFSWGLCVEDVGSFHDGNAGVDTEAVIEEAVRGVDCVDVCGTVLEEAIGETADAATEVGAGSIIY